MKKLIYSAIALLLSACGDPDGKVIVKIPEASGIDYCQNSDTLIVANDEGSYYEISPKGKILQKVKLGKYDFEGVVCEEERMIFVRENKGIIIVHKDSEKITKIPFDTFYNGKKLSLFDKDEGIEGIAKVGNTIYLAKQYKKSEDSFVAVVKMTPYPARVVDIIEHHIADTSGLTLHEGSLYMVSDKEDIIIKYDLQNKKILQKVKLPKGAWEGIAFDTNGYVYLADDDGRVLKYKKEFFGL